MAPARRTTREHLFGFARAFALGAAAIAGACQTPATPTQSTAGARRTPIAAEHDARDDAREPVRLPDAASDFGPSRLAVAGGSPNDARAFAGRLAQTQDCANCHADVAATYASSAHRFASLSDPLYLASVDAFRDKRGAKTSRFCGGCHDPVPMAAGTLDGAFAASDRASHAGVTCLVCHGIAKSTRDGNGSYALDTSPVPIPQPGDAASVERHRARVMRQTTRSVDVCVGCHKAFLARETGNVNHLPGQDDVTSWSRSAYAGSHADRVDGSASRQDCVDCHMPRVRAVRQDAAKKGGLIRSHRFAGGNTALAAFRGDAAQLEATRAMLRRAARLTVSAVRNGDERVLVSSAAHDAPRPSSIRVRANDELLVDITIQNVGAGHRFPGGVADLQDTWIALEVVDLSTGQVIAEAGEPTGPSDATTHVLSAAPIDEHGRRDWLHRTERFRAIAFDSTVPPRASRVVRYAIPIGRGAERGPSEASIALGVRARLLHRARNSKLAQGACTAQRTARGEQARLAAFVVHGVHVDACRPQPVTEVAAASANMKTGAWTGAADPLRALVAYGRGLLGHTSEYAHEARAPLMLALDRARTPDERADAMQSLAKLAAIEGRIESTERWVALARREVGEHPALSATLGHAYASRWQNDRGARELAMALERTPLDDRLFVALSSALSSTGDFDKARNVASRGLLLSPRDPDLLRLQWQGLASRPGRDVRASSSSFVAFRSPDDANDLRSLCSEHEAGCAGERLDVHKHPVHRRGSLAMESSGARATP